MISQQLLYLADLAPKGCSSDFFGLVPWYHYLPSTDFGVIATTKSGTTTYTCDINGNFFNHILDKTSELPLILLAIVDDLLRIAGLLAIGFVIYGAFQYIASQGSPDATAKAQSTITNALIGLGIAIVAITFVSFLGRTLG